MNGGDFSKICVQNSWDYKNIRPQFVHREKQMIWYKGGIIDFCASKYTFTTDFSREIGLTSCVWYSTDNIGSQFFAKLPQLRSIEILHMHWIVDGILYQISVSKKILARTSVPILLHIKPTSLSQKKKFISFLFLSYVKNLSVTCDWDTLWQLPWELRQGN